MIFYNIHVNLEIKLKRFEMFRNNNIHRFATILFNRYDKNKKNTI